MSRRGVALVAVLAAAFPSGASASQVVRLRHGAVLTVPSGSLSAGARIVQRRAGGSSVRLVVRGGRVVGTLRLSFPFHHHVRTGGMPLNLTVQVRFRDHATKQWVTVPTRVDVRRHRVTAIISPNAWNRANLTLGGVGGGGAGGSTWWNPLSWDWGSISLRLDQRIGELRGARTGPAPCNGSGAPAWANVNVDNAADLPLRTCVESQAGNAVVQIVNNRPYGVILTYGAPVAWGWHEQPDDAAGSIATSMADSLVAPNELYLAPRKRGSVGVPVGSWSFAKFQASITRKSLAADVVSVAFDSLDTKLVRPQAVGTLVASCSWLLKPTASGLPTIERGSVISNIQDIAGCLSDAAPKLAAAGLLDGRRVDQLQHAFALLSKINKAALAVKVSGALADLYVGSRADMQANATFAIGRRYIDQGPTSGASAPSPGGSSTPSPTPNPSPPSGPAPSTWAETAGGLARTWTNWTNAGGQEGASVAARQTIQVACKLSGFRVANGNTWWYRIASAPWNGQYYVSADAFYNNGATSGPLSGTPYVDSSVRDC